MPLRLLLVVLVSAALVAGVLAAPATADVTLPSPTTDVDYQLGGTKALPKRVGIVVRDREARPSKRAYSVCYVNGFQTQPGERRFWRTKHWGLVLKKAGKPVVDSAWGEWLLDIRTPAKRQRLATIMRRWVQGCADDGYEAVEYDNLDSFSRSSGLLKPRHAKHYARRLVAAAHDAGLAAAQKNRAGWDGTTVGYDFAITEECGRWKECGSYRSHYGNLVLVVEYRAKDFRYACERWGSRLPIVLRDKALTPKGIRRYC